MAKGDKHEEEATCVAFASYGDGGSDGCYREPLAAFASVDMSDEDADDFMEAIEAQRLPVGMRMPYDRDHTFPLAEQTLAKILASLKCRYLVGLHDRRPAIARAVTDLLCDPLTALPNGGAAHIDLTGRLSAIVMSRLECDDFCETIQGMDSAFSRRDIQALMDVLDIAAAGDDLVAILCRNEGLVVENWGRYRPESLFELVDLESTFVALHAHRDYWGRRHRHIATTCAGGTFPPGRVPTGGRFLERETTAWFGGATQGSWRAWRSDGPIEYLEVDDSPSLELAAFLASAAAFVKASENTTLGPMIAQHYFGPVPFIEGASQPALVGIGRKPANAPRRGKGRGVHVQAERLPDASQPAGRTAVDIVSASRDRLLQKLLSNGLEPGAALLLRVDGMDVDDNGSLFARSSSRNEPIFKMGSFDADDFWRLVRASKALDGFLFSRLEGDGTYGRLKMTRKELETRIASSRAA